MKIILLLFGLLACVEGAHKKVLLSDVNTITLKEGQMTTGRRSSPVPQMKCVGGAAAHRFVPRVAQCTKAGFNGLDYEWRCVAEMPTDYEFGKITVTCEGFDHPDDPYILHGSCGLEYDLEYTADLKRRTPQHEEATNIFGTWAVIVFIVFVAFYMCLTKSRGEDSPDGASRRYPNDGPGYPPGPNDQDYPTKPPSYGNPSAPPPPSYDDTMRSENVRQRPNYSAPPNEGTRQGFGWNSRPRTMGFGRDAGAAGGQGGAGFWTGAGLGALGGYFMGRRQGQQPEPTRTRPSSSTYSSGYSRPSSSVPSCSSSDMHQSTGYGGTSRR